MAHLFKKKKRPYCASCDGVNPYSDNTGNLTRHFFAAKTQKDAGALRCVCKRSTISGFGIEGWGAKASVLLGSMFLMSLLGQAQDGVLVQSEKVYLGKNMQPAQSLQVIPLVAPPNEPITKAVPDAPVTELVVADVQDAEPVSTLKIVPVTAKMKAAAKKLVAKSEPKPEKEAARQEPEPLPKFELLQSDHTLSLGLRRWAGASGYQLVWDSPKDFPAQHTEYPVDSFEEAVEGVMKDTARSAYPLHACSYRNKVIRVLHVSQSCER